jgi:hypothetical protein
MLGSAQSIARRSCPELLISLRSGWTAFLSTSSLQQTALDAGTAPAVEQTTLVAQSSHEAQIQKVLATPIELHPSAYKGSQSEIDSALELFRLHNSSMKVSGGHMIKARVLDVDRKKITLDTGVKMAKIAVTDITPECILEQMPTADGSPRTPGEILAGDIVQVYLEHEETPEGDMLVSGQQAAVRRRVRAVWKELQDRMEDGKPVKGRILNSVAGGYSVGVAGLVCFLPNSVATRATTRRIGELQDFKVTQMNPSRTNVVLTDWRYNPNQQHNNNRHHGGNAKWRQQQQPRQRDVIKEAAGLKEELEGKAPTPAAQAAGAVAP